MFSVSLSMSALFRLVGAIAATPTHAQAYAATTILVLIITSGFAIIRSEWCRASTGGMSNMCLCCVRSTHTVQHLRDRCCVLVLAMRSTHCHVVVGGGVRLLGPWHIM
jgi:hypothetical protein